MNKRLIYGIGKHQSNHREHREEKLECTEQISACGRQQKDLCISLCSPILNSVSSVVRKFSCLLVICILIYVSNVFAYAQDKIIYDDKGRRDPFIALVTADGRLLNFEPVNKEAKIVLEGIIYDKDGRSYALINGEVVGVGDYFQGLAVFKIEENKIILLKDNKPVEYILEKEEL